MAIGDGNFKRGIMKYQIKLNYNVNCLVLYD